MVENVENKQDSKQSQCLARTIAAIVVWVVPFISGLISMSIKVVLY